MNQANSLRAVGCWKSHLKKKEEDKWKNSQTQREIVRENEINNEKRKCIDEEIKMTRRSKKKEKMKDRKKSTKRKEKMKDRKKSIKRKEKMKDRKKSIKRKKKIRERKMSKRK
jgi:hypothetical protein